MYTYTFMIACMYMYMYMYICMYMYEYMYMCIYINMYLHIYSCMHICTTLQHISHDPTPPLKKCHITKL